MEKHKKQTKHFSSPNAWKCGVVMWTFSSKLDNGVVMEEPKKQKKHFSSQNAWNMKQNPNK